MLTYTVPRLGEGKYRNVEQIGAQKRMVATLDEFGDEVGTQLRYAL
jgi:hypothetical protein